MICSVLHWILLWTEVSPVAPISYVGLLEMPQNGPRYFKVSLEKEVKMHLLS